MSTSSFDVAVKVVLFHEGGFSENPKDPGGPTNYGISLSYLRELEYKNPSAFHGFFGGHLDKESDVTPELIHNMPPSVAMKIYRIQWWDRYRYGELNAQCIATKVFDTAVNMGAGRSACLLQESIRNNGSLVNVDGVIGSETIEKANGIDPSKLLLSFENNQADYYMSLFRANPVARRPFIKGWLARAYDKV